MKLPDESLDHRSIVCVVDQCTGCRWNTVIPREYVTFWDISYRNVLTRSRRKWIFKEIKQQLIPLVYNNIIILIRQLTHINQISLELLVDAVY